SFGRTCLVGQSCQRETCPKCIGCAGRTPDKALHSSDCPLRCLPGWVSGGHGLGSVCPPWRFWHCGTVALLLQGPAQLPKGQSLTLSPLCGVTWPRGHVTPATVFCQWPSAETSARKARTTFPLTGVRALCARVSELPDH